MPSRGLSTRDYTLRRVAAQISILTEEMALRGRNQTRNFGLAMGFELVGTYRRIGWKHGTWHDVAWVQRTFATGQDPPVEPQ